MTERQVTRPSVEKVLPSAGRLCGVQHNGHWQEVGTYWTLHNLDQGDTLEHYLRVFDISGVKPQSDLSDEDFASMSSQDLRERLEADLYHVQRCVPPSLENGHKLTGFDDHGSVHAGNVVDGGLALLGLTDYDNEAVRRRVIAVGELHDNGATLSRPIHSDVSEKLFRRMFPNFKDGEDRRIIEEAIRLHEIGAVSEIMDKHIFACGGNMQRVYENMLREYGPELFILIIADKTDAGIQRASKVGQENYEVAKDLDPHLVKAVLGGTDYVGLSGDRKSFVWRRKFNPEERFRQHHEERDLAGHWVNVVLDLEGEKRVPAVAVSAFTVFPNVKNFTLEFTDENGKLIRTVNFNRDENPFKAMHDSSRENEFSQLIGQLGLVSEGLGVTSVKHLGDGAFSSTYRVSSLQGDFVCKTLGYSQDIRFKGWREYAEHLLHDSRDLPGTVKVHGVFALTKSGQVVQVENMDKYPEDVQMVFSVQDAMPRESVQFLSILRKKGLKTIQDGRVTCEEDSALSGEEIYRLYFGIVNKLVMINSRDGDVVDPVESYRDSLQYLVTDPTRFDGVAQKLPEVRDLLGTKITEVDVVRLRSGMLELVGRYSQKYGGSRLRRVHGDAWASNYFVDGEKNTHIIDPGKTEASDSALDLVFTLSDLAFIAVNKRGGIGEGINRSKYVAMADNLVEEYMHAAGDSDIRKTMALIFGYKAFVAGLFDAGPNDQQRQDLIDAALGAVEMAKTNDDFQFHFRDLYIYKEVGRNCRLGRGQSK
jgi:hypothetical protein